MDSYLSMADSSSNKDASFHKKVKLISELMNRTLKDCGSTISENRKNKNKKRAMIIFYGNLL